MKHRVWIVVVMLLLLATSMVAAEEVRQLSFDQAVELMSANNIALKIAEMNLEIAEIDYQKAVASNLMSGSQQTQMQAEHSLERAKNSYNTSKRNNYLDVFRAYTNCLSAERTLQVREYELTIAEHDYAVIQEKVRIGDAGRLDDLQEMNRVESARRNKNTASQTLAENRRVLQRLLGIEDATGVQLSADFQAPEFDLTLEESIELGLANSFNLWDLESSLDLQGRQLATAKIDGTAPIDLRRSELNTAISKLNLEQEKDSIVENITSQFDALDDSLIRYESAKRDWEIASETYEIYRRQEEIGLITAMQLLQQEISMLNSKSSLEDALVSYIISCIQLHHVLGLEGSIQ